MTGKDNKHISWPMTDHWFSVYLNRRRRYTTTPTHKTTLVAAGSRETRCMHFSPLCRILHNSRAQGLNTTKTVHCRNCPHNHVTLKMRELSGRMIRSSSKRSALKGIHCHPCHVRWIPCNRNIANSFPTFTAYHLLHSLHMFPVYTTINQIR